MISSRLVALTGGGQQVTELVLLAGQSNMVGQGPYDPMFDTTSPKIRQFGGRPSLPNYRTTVEAVDPLAHNDISAGVGPGMAFARRRIALRPGNTVVLVPTAVSATSLYAPAYHWMPYGGGNLFKAAVIQANLAMAANPGAIFSGILWLQGENDSLVGITQSQYYQPCADMIAAFRSQITGATNSWFILGRMIPEVLSGWVGASAIDAAHTQIAETIPRCAIVGGIAPGNSIGDNLHYSAAAQRLIGTGMANAAQAFA